MNLFTAIFSLVVLLPVFLTLAQIYFVSGMLTNAHTASPQIDARIRSEHQRAVYMAILALVPQVLMILIFAWSEFVGFADPSFVGRSTGLLLKALLFLTLPLLVLSKTYSSREVDNGPYRVFWYSGITNAVLFTGFAAILKSGFPMGGHC